MTDARKPTAAESSEDADRATGATYEHPDTYDYSNRALEAARAGQHREATDLHEQAAAKHRELAEGTTCQGPFIHGVDCGCAEEATEHETAADSHDRAANAHREEEIAAGEWPELTNLDITPRTKQLFVDYANDAGNWSGHPLVGGNVGTKKADQGNLTDLKRHGLVTTQEDEGCHWLSFTDKGRAYAYLLGIQID